MENSIYVVIDTYADSTVIGYWLDPEEAIKWAYMESRKSLPIPYIVKSLLIDLNRRGYCKTSVYKIQEVKRIG